MRVNFPTQFTWKIGVAFGIIGLILFTGIIPLKNILIYAFWLEVASATLLALGTALKGL